MKQSFYILLFLIFAGKASAQGNNPYWSNQIFRAGPILGLNFSQVDGDSDAGVHKMGLHTGLGSYVSLSQRLGIQLDLLFSQKGSRFAHQIVSPSLGPYFEVYKMKLNYIEIPLSLNFYYTSDIHFGAGASFNRLIGSKETFTGLFGTTTFDPDVYRFEKNTWDGFLSASYRLTDKMRVEVRYQRSITPIRERFYAPEKFSNGPHQANNLFVLQLAYYL